MLPAHPQFAPAGPESRTALIARRAQWRRCLRELERPPGILTPKGALPSVPPAIPAGVTGGGY